FDQTINELSEQSAGNARWRERRVRNSKSSQCEPIVLKGYLLFREDGFVGLDCGDRGYEPFLVSGEGREIFGQAGQVLSKGFGIVHIETGRKIFDPGADGVAVRDKGLQ